MNLKELKAAGGFVPAAPVSVPVTWERAGKDPVSFDVAVKRHSFGTIERLFADNDDERSRSAAYIAASILLEGVPMTYEDAYQLEPSLAGVLIRAINQVNGTGQEPKN